MKTRRKQRGFSLPEVLIGITIVMGVLWVNIANYLEGGRTAARVGTENAFLIALSDCARGMKTGPTFAAVTNAVLIASTCLDKYEVIAGGVISNTFGGLVTFGTADVFGVTGNVGTVTSTGYSRDVCTRLAATHHAKFTHITINTVAVKEPSAPLVITPALVTANCAAATNTIIFGMM